MTQDSSKALTSYRYHIECHSLLFPFVEKWLYLPVLRRTPRWIHANTLSAVGGTCMVGSAALCVVFAEVAGLRLLPAVAAVLLAGYNTFDNVDGPQARRTGTSGPLGELVDHAIDAVTFSLIPLGVMVAVQADTALIPLVVAAGCWAYWASMWELHHRGTLVTAAVADVEACAALVALLVVTAAIGVEPLHVRLLGLGPSLVEVVMGAAVLGFGWQVLGSVRRQATTRIRLEALYVALPLVIYLAWFAASDAIPLIAVALGMGVTMARSSIETIVTRLHQSTYRPIAVTLWAAPLGGLALTAVPGLPEGTEALYAWSTAAVLYAGLLTRVWTQIRLISTSLGIRVFAVPA